MFLILLLFCRIYILVDHCICRNLYTCSDRHIRSDRRNIAEAEGRFRTVLPRHGQLIVFATKADKVSKKELEENLSLIFSTLMMGEDDVLIPFSAQNGLNADVAWDVINQLCGLEES